MEAALRRDDALIRPKEDPRMRAAGSTLTGSGAVSPAPRVFSGRWVPGSPGPDMGVAHGD
ncbi:hypothetical protein GCM10018953_23430 [Streptosporangium nondiastaticum]